MNYNFKMIKSKKELSSIVEKIVINQGTEIEVEVQEGYSDFEHLTHLYLEYLQKFQADAIRDFCPHMNSIRSGGMITIQTLKSLLEIPSLKSIRAFVNLYPSAEILQNSKHLEQIRIAANQQQMSEFIQNASSQLENIVCFGTLSGKLEEKDIENLARMKKLKQIEIKQAESQNPFFNKIFVALPHLTHITICCFFFNTGLCELKDQNLRIICESVSCLVSLFINCNHITDVGLIFIGAHSHSLKSLAVDNVDSMFEEDFNPVTNKGIQFICNNFIQLERLSICINDISEKVVQAASKNLKKLTRLDIIGKLDEFLEEHQIQRAKDLIATAKDIKTLVLTHIVTDQTVKFLSENLKNLETFKAFLSQIHDSACFYLSLLKNLRKFFNSEAGGQELKTFISDVGIMKLIRNNRRSILMFKKWHIHQKTVRNIRIASLPNLIGTIINYHEEDFDEFGDLGDLGDVEDLQEEEQVRSESSD